MRISALFEDEAESLVGTIITICGWAKTVRSADKGAICFVALNDGSDFESIQVVCDQTVDGFAECLETGVGSSYRFTGTLIESPGN